MELDRQKRIMVAMTGASGMAYSHRLLEVLPSVYDMIYMAASQNAAAIIKDELNIDKPSGMVPSGFENKFKLFETSDFFAPTASGSHDYDGMVIIPCSMGVVGRIAAGVSTDLITRSADVCLKEKRKLVLVVRESPLNLIHLRSLTTLAEAGAVILPAAPAFYNKPNSINDLVEFIVDRVLRALDLDIRLIEGWGG